MDRPDIARLNWSSARVAHCLLPPWRANEYVTVSEPGSVAVAFTFQPTTTIETPSGPVRERQILANSIGLGSPDPVHWLAVPYASDTIEITASPAVRHAIARELGVAQHAELDDLYGWSDPVILAIARRLRAAARGWSPASDVERDSLVHAAYARSFQLKFGGRLRGTGALDQARLDRTIAFIRAELHREIGLADLAAVAALSPFHFARSFARATGHPPHRFVTAMRLERARDLIAHSALSVEAVAAAVGFSNTGHFRRLFRAHFGARPADMRRKTASFDPSH